MNTSFIHKFYLDITPNDNKENKQDKKLEKTSKEIDSFFKHYYSIFGF